VQHLAGLAHHAALRPPAMQGQAEYRRKDFDMKLPQPEQIDRCPGVGEVAGEALWMERAAVAQASHGGSRELYLKPMG
jgi:hypothetical protein